MALDKFELKKEHLILLRNLGWESISKDRIATLLEEGAETPFGGIDIVEDIGNMLYGKPETDALSVDPLSPFGPEYTDEQKENIQTILSELPRALEIVLYLKTFELGHYTKKWNLKDWKRHTKKSKRMTYERFKELFDETESESESDGDNAFQGLQIISKYTTNLVQGAAHNVIYTEDVEDLIKAKITEEDVIKLAKLNWVLENGTYLAYFV
tara:strand:- start:1867 stop:2502 length:636 start_codon:yes stop_codon:yes gene_type:complete